MISSNINIDGERAIPVDRPASVAARASTAKAVRDGLLGEQKSLPPWLLYDHVGSSLFDEITRLPEYYPSRTERSILSTYAGDMMESAGFPSAVIELGAGSASKTRLLLEALLKRQSPVRYTPVDVSPTALAQAVQGLEDLRRLEICPVVARYPDDMSFLRKSAGRRLVLFLGSNIGNYEPAAAGELLSAVSSHLVPGDALLIGTDLRKSSALLLPAYDDAEGVTARFNKNVLSRINRELGGTFDVDRFEHVVCWNRLASRVELYLESTAEQCVAIHGLQADVHFTLGERIHTEFSYKFTTRMIRRLLNDSGFSLGRSWCDKRRWYALHLARVDA